MSETPGYRRDIDGLRAVAVIAVIVHHLFPGSLPGGYVGVDIFFVISGFLITSLIHREIESGRFSVRRFYQRRINRLLPALLVVVSVSGVAALLLLGPTDLILFAQSAFSSVVGLSNVFFWLTYGNYFGTNADEAILLHTWTLGVEEQFYLLWPVLMLVAVRFRPLYLLPLAGAATVAAVLVSEYGLQNYASASYYLLPTRFFELAIGGTLAFWLRDRGPLGSPVATWVAGLAGLALLATSFVMLTPESPFPGVTGLLPCLGSALLILAGADSRSFVARLLGLPAMVVIGLISYSLYLWHWPFVAYFNYSGISIGPPQAIAILCLVAVLSVLTWRFVEVPFRTGGAKLAFRRVVARRFVLPAATLAVIALVTSAAGGFPGRYPATVAALEAMSGSHPDELRSGCHVPTAQYAAAPSPECRLGDPGSPIEGILLGDSFANHYTGMLDEMARAQGLALIDYTMDGCPPIPGYSPPTGASYAAKCLARNEAAFSEAARPGYRLVVLAGSWPMEDSVSRLIRSGIDRLRSSGVHVAVILRNPTIHDGATCPIRRLMYRQDRSCDAPETAQAPYWAAIERDYSDVTFIEPGRLICDQGRCDPMLDGVLLYRDDDHLDDPGSRLLGRKLVEQGVQLWPEG